MFLGKVSRRGLHEGKPSIRYARKDRLLTRHVIGMVKSSPIARTAHDKIKNRVGTILKCRIIECMTVILYGPLEMMENVLSKCQGNL